MTELQTMQPSLWQGDTEHVPVPARLIKVRQLTPNEKYFAVRLENPVPLVYAPGQFAQVWVPMIGEAPISISSAADGSDFLEMAIRRVGSVTRALHAMSEGGRIGIRGPYGHGFPMEQLRGNDLLIIAGGIGYAPLRSLLRCVQLSRHEFGRVTLLYGARTPQDFLFYDELQQMTGEGDVTVHLTIDRPAAGWTGHVGVVTTLMTDLKILVPRTFVVVCGPPVMYKFVLIALDKYHLPPDRILLSLERRMECGVGKCGHCQINNKYVCKDGPVFDFKTVRHLPEAFAMM
jgi:sulfhydrogenase subunit gamma (sulfur reductase)